MNRYIRQILFITLIIIGIVASTNWLVNPYLMFESPVIPGVNEIITENYYKQLIHKPYQLRQIQPRSIIIGASQSGVGLNPDTLQQPAFNLAVGGSTIYLQHRLLQEAVSNNPELQNVILEAPFFAFNELDPNNQKGAEPALDNRLLTQLNGERNLLLPYFAAKEILSSLLSWDVLRASLRTIVKQSDISKRKRGGFIQKRNGQWIQQANPNVKTYQIIENSWKKSIFNDWLPLPNKAYQLPEIDKGTLNYFRSSLKMLYGKNIDTNIVIAPMHASLFVALKETGIWPQYQQWKRSLVIINEQEANSAGKNPYLIIDYAEINEKTTEALPEKTSTAPMIWFNDSMHPSPTYGDLILQEIVTGIVSSGTLLSGNSIEDKLAGDELKVQRYTNLHPEIQSAIRTLIANSATPSQKQSR